MSGGLKYAKTVERLIRNHFATLRRDYEAAVSRLKQENSEVHKRQISILEDALKPKGSVEEAYSDALRDLDRATRAGALHSLEINATWQKRYEGPQCKVEVYVTSKTRDADEFVTTKYTSTYTTGGNYDKLSTAINEALEHDPVLLRAIIEAGPLVWKEQYAIRDQPYPRLAVNGKGVETFRSLFKPYGRPALKGKWEWNHEEDKRSDRITVRRIR